MPPVREYSNWSERASDYREEVEPLRKYVFICEGSKTEVHYFKWLVDYCKLLDLHPLVDLRLWEKIGDDESSSNPMRLIQFAHDEKKNPELKYHKGFDRMVIVFDLDIYCRVGEGRTGAEECAQEFEKLKSVAADDDILAVSNPSFELFLLLHYDDAYERIIKPHKVELLENRKIGDRRYAERLCSDVFKMNPKKNPKIGELALRVNTAIEQEKYLNQDIERALVVLTSNVGSVIDAIQRDRLDFSNQANAEAEEN